MKNTIVEAVRPQINKITRTRVTFAILETVLVSGMVIAFVILGISTAALF